MSSLTYARGVMSAYREGSHPSGKIDCPRCKKLLPPLDVATCDAQCGTWVTAEVASIALAAEELVEDRLTRWWRMRAPCPVCAETMKLHGVGQAIFQGCEKHGYFLDADIIMHTGLGRTGVVDAVEHYRASQEQARVDAVRRAAEREEQARIASEQQRLAEEKRRAEEAERAAENERRAAEKRANAEKRAAEKREKEERELAQMQARKERKAAEKRAAAEKERAQREQLRNALLTRVNEAIARGSADVLVDEIMRLDERVAAIEKKLRKVVTFE